MYEYGGTSLLFYSVIFVRLQRIISNFIEDRAARFGIKEIALLAMKMRFGIELRMRRQIDFWELRNEDNLLNDHHVLSFKESSK